MKSRRVLLLVHPKYHPDRRRAPAGTESDVWKALRKLGYVAEVAEADRELRSFDRRLVRFRPDIVFNLLEEFRGEGVFDFHLITYLEALGIPYTGCNPRGLIVSRDKNWVCRISSGAGIRVPKTSIVKGSGLRVSLPLIVKYNREDASLGIAKSNVVRTQAQLRREMNRLSGLGFGEMIAQEFIAGREVTVSVWGHHRPEAFIPWQLHLPKATDIATAKVKFDASYRRRKGIQARKYSGEDSGILMGSSTRIFKALGLSGYARMDFRIAEDGDAYLIDVNANPNLARTEDFAMSARRHGYEYPEVIRRVIEMGMKYKPAK
jgi:D-alanine-D-alanine ligase